MYKKYFSPDCILATGISSSETGLFREHLIDHNMEIIGGEVPVGYAVEGKKVLLLDDAGKQLDFNQVGEIAVRSRYLSPGYWGNPDLTGAKFKADAESGDGRLYLTGDLGMMLPDGCLIHKGRRDFRVKIRGYGVEIGEVEKAILAHESIGETVVVARENDFGETRLIAYFVSSVQPGTRASELRAFFKQRLPDYMIPSAFVMLDKMPLTAGGKIDRQSLPDPGNSRPCPDTPYAPPTTPVEEELANIWAEILSLDQVGIHDDFFELGGHSLTATRVISRVIKTFQLDVPLQALFQAPTVAAMAAVITEHQAQKLGEQDLDRILADLEALPEEEARRLARGGTEVTENQDE
ncbi:MAG: phosphopantetheine-binding protein [Candidatus Binatia bacterium]